MPIKILRLGFTEMNLLFCYWYEKIYNKKESNKLNTILQFKNKFIKWFYTTSGYYDKTIISDYMDAHHTNNNDPDTYNKYFSTLYDFIKKSNCTYGTHYNEEEPEFKDFYNNLEIFKICEHSIFFDKIKGHKLLIISPFAKLFKIQYESGNCNKIYKNFPIIEKINYYTNIYTFFNKGPHNNIFETVDYLVEDIRKTIEDDYDMVVISAGAYSNIIAKRFYDLNKNVYVLGGLLQSFFGILNERTKYFYNRDNIKLENEEYWITKIPDEYKPHDYMKIENGCYW
jgi:hypothetical protein